MTALLGAVTRPRMVPRSWPQHVQVAAARNVTIWMAKERCIRGSFFAPTLCLRWYSHCGDPNTGTWTEQYGLISMLPGFHEGRYVFVVGTGSAEGDWASAECVTTPKYVRELVGRLRL